MKKIAEHIHCRQCLLSETQSQRSKGTASILSLFATGKKVVFVKLCVKLNLWKKFSLHVVSQKPFPQI